MPQLAPCFKTRLRLVGQRNWKSGDDVIVRPGQGSYTSACESLKSACTTDPDTWLNTRVEVQALDLDFIGADNISQATDLDWDSYHLTAKQTITISDA
jgi:hypothetical protein